MAKILLNLSYRSATCREKGPFNASLTNLEKFMASQQVEKQKKQEGGRGSKKETAQLFGSWDGQAVCVGVQSATVLGGRGSFSLLLWEWNVSAYA